MASKNLVVRELRQAIRDSSKTDDVHIYNNKRKNCRTLKVYTDDIVYSKLEKSLYDACSRLGIAFGAPDGITIKQIKYSKNSGWCRIYDSTIITINRKYM